MKRVFVSFFIFILSGYFYLYAANNGATGYYYSYDSQTASSQFQEDTYSTHNFSISAFQDNGDDDGTGSNNSGRTGIFQDNPDDPVRKAPPPGGGPPIGGVTPVGPGLQVLMWLSFGYVFYIVAFNSKKEKTK